ncbi:MAG TPA: lamin tail domain-containing protein [Verrucomicrobiae bacterium]
MRLAALLPVFFSIFSLAVFTTTHAQSVRINEVFADNKTNVFSDGSISDWVELVNNSPTAVNLSGYSLTDSAAAPQKWIIPNGVTLVPQQTLVVLLDSSRPASTSAGAVLNAGFSIKATGDRLDLYAPGLVLSDSVRFGPQAANYTIGRFPDGSGDFTLTRPTPNSINVPTTLGSQATLRINEWMASPSSGNDWFEIYNPDPLPVQLTGLYFTDNGNVPSQVAPLSYIGAGLDGFLQMIADNSMNDNEVDFGLSGNGDSIGMFRSDGSPIDRVQFGAQQAGISQGRMPDGSDSILNLTIPTPGDSNLIRYEGLVVNELLSHSDPPYEDAVEFLNVTDAAINIGGWYLSDSRNDLKRYRIPDNTIVPARGYVVFYQHQFNGPAAATPFSFSSAYEDEVYLSQAVNGNLTGYIVEETFEPAANNVSFGRVNTSVPGDYKFVAMERPTFGVNNPGTVEQFRTGTGAENSPPRVGPVVINEIMYNPPSVDGVTDNTTDEFIELLNITSQPVPLFDPANPANQWRLQGAASFTFPANTTLAANGVALVVSFDPADTTALNAFRTQYNVPTSTPVYGPYVGKLSNSGDEVELYRPDPPQLPPRPDAGFVPYIRVDKVNYSDAAPWPAEADGTGNSLQRRNAQAFGNDPVNWQATAPTAGQVPTGGGSGTTVQIARSANSVTISFNTTAGRSYTVQYKDDLGSTAAWQTLSSVTAAGASASVQDTNISGRAHRFYRVVSQP